MTKEEEDLYKKLLEDKEIIKKIKEQYGEKYFEFEVKKDNNSEEKLKQK